MTKERLFLFDTTLRDGAQTTGVDFSLADKRHIAAMLDSLGLDYIDCPVILASAWRCSALSAAWISLATSRRACLRDRSSIGAPLSVARCSAILSVASSISRRRAVVDIPPSRRTR